MSGCLFTTPYRDAAEVDRYLELFIVELPEYAWELHKM